MKKKFFVVAATCISSSIIAQQTQDSSKTKQLDEVVVTANKYPQKLSSTGKVLTVINRDQLEKNTGRTLAQVLNEQAGLVVNGAQGPLGTNLLVYMRGAGTANTLILIDGVPANDASGITAEFDINHLSIDQVERIEILKGAQSVLYGSDAVAGVINIITRKQTGNKPLAGNATVAGGSYGSFKGSAGIGGKHNKFDYKAQYSYLRSDGFSAAFDPTGTSKYDNDGYRQHLVAMNVGMQATDHWQLRAAGQYGEYKADIDDGGLADDKNNTIKNKNLQLTLSSVNQFSAGSLHVNLNLNNTNRELDDAINTPVGPNDYDPFHGEYKGKSVFAEAYSNLSLQKHIGMLLGVDYRGQKASIETTYGKLGEDSLTAHQESGYASFFVKDLNGFNAELGARYTHHSVFGSAFTYSFNPSYTIAEQVKFFANIASGFRAPSLYHLASEYGNARLQPEKSTSYEGGVQYFNKGNTVNIRVNYFNRIIRDVIIFRSLSAPPYAQ
ncbi:MAG TPA: TonB-dependent receptor, partial [Chitinophagaceae bacterium]|nr:TonB-dependent receptor [Chitinophagaceae bacterium]